MKKISKTLTILLITSLTVLSCSDDDESNDIANGNDDSNDASYPTGTVHCDPNNITKVVDVTNPTTGKVWMDRNLGASQVATSSTDAAAYGDLYQWGRAADGHQCRDSETITTLSSTDQPGHGDFIISSFEANFDWRSPQNDNLWQGVNGTNNPCPSGYRLPTEAELDNERLSWSELNRSSAFASPLKWTVGGHRRYSFGDFEGIRDTDSGGYYWGSTISSSGTRSTLLMILPGIAITSSEGRAYGCSVRCIKD